MRGRTCKRIVGLILGAAAGAVISSAALVHELAPPFRVEANGKPIDVAIGHAAPLVADFDGDGNSDLIVGQFGDGKLRIYRNQGNIGTKERPELAGPVTLIEAAAQGRQVLDQFDNPQRSAMRAKVAVVDWNNDGKLDLIVGDFVSGGARKYHGWVWVYLRQGSGVTAQIAK